MTISIPKRRRLDLAVPALLAALVLLYGCGDDSNATFVDFSRKVAVERPGDPPCEDDCLTVAVASMISARETAVHYHRLLDYMAGRLGRRIRLIQRKTYGEINTLIGQGRIDLAFICSGPYIGGREKYGFEALAVPEVRGSHFYRAYLIVNRDSPYRSLEDLRGRTFAFTDPQSNTGKLVPTYWLKTCGETPQGFFGNPPVVVSARLPARLKERMRRILYQMHRDRQGRQILDELMIDRFVAASEDWYRPILAMQSAVAARGQAP